MVKKILFIAFVLFNFAAKAQLPFDEVSIDTAIFPLERTKLSINSNFLLAGELLQYKAFILDASNKESTLSKMAYVSLRNEKDSVVFNHKLKVENGTASGDFFIPASLKTGVYSLIGYTNFSRNNIQEPTHALREIFVVNPFLKTVIKGNSTIDTVKLDITKNREVALTGDEGISIKLNKSSFGKREKVALKIENLLGLPEKGNFLLSVRKTNPLNLPDLNEKGRKETSQVFYIPELRGEIISGVVVTVSNNKPAANKAVSITIPGKDYIFKLAKTNSNGRFFFSIDEDYQTSNSVIQINEPNREEYKLALDKKDFRLNRSNAQKALYLDPNLKDWLTERSVQLQIENGYFNIKKDSVLPRWPNEPFYDGLATEYILDDYTRFPTVIETFVEVVTLAGIRKEVAGHKFVVFNQYDPERRAKFNSIDPLVMMDGMMIQDNEDVIKYNPKDIRRVDVLPQPYRYGPNIYSGVISISTKKGDFKPKVHDGDMQELELMGPLGSKKYYSPSYANDVTLHRIPDYRVQLLWQPDLELLEKDYSKTFNTSDVTGTFEISLEGYTGNGKYIYKKQFFTVE